MHNINHTICNKKTILSKIYIDILTFFLFVWKEMRNDSYIKFDIVKNYV